MKPQGPQAEPVEMKPQGPQAEPKPQGPHAEPKPQGPHAEPVATGFPVGIAPAGSAGHGVASAWSSGLFDCFDDCGLCCVACWCPCITFGKVAEIVDRGSTSCGTAGALYVLLLTLTGCQFIYSCGYRSKMRAQYRLPDEPCCDCCVHYCCEPCALVQEYKELKVRGYDPEIGWQLNAERGNGNAAGRAPGMQHMGR